MLYLFWLITFCSLRYRSTGWQRRWVEIELKVENIKQDNKGSVGQETEVIYTYINKIYVLICRIVRFSLLISLVILATLFQPLINNLSFYYLINNDNGSETRILSSDVVLGS